MHKHQGGKHQSGQKKSNGGSGDNGQLGPLGYGSGSSVDPLAQALSRHKSPATHIGIPPVPSTHQVVANPPILPNGASLGVGGSGSGWKVAPSYNSPPIQQFQLPAASPIQQYHLPPVQPPVQQYQLPVQQPALPQFQPNYYQQQPQPQMMYQQQAPAMMASGYQQSLPPSSNANGMSIQQMEALYPPKNQPPSNPNYSESGSASVGGSGLSSSDVNGIAEAIQQALRSETGKQAMSAASYGR